MGSVTITIKNGNPCPFCWMNNAIGIDEDEIQCQNCNATAVISNDEQTLTWSKYIEAR